MTDQEILQLYKIEKSKEKAFTFLVNIYSKKMYLHVRRMVQDHDDANDVVQNAFIKIWKALPNFKEEATLYTWMYRIATNEALTFLSKNKKRKQDPIELHESSAAFSISGASWIDSESIEKKLEYAISQLPDKQKQVFILRYYDEMKYEEMEKILDTSVGALKASFHHAVKKVEFFLKGI